MSKSRTKPASFRFGIYTRGKKQGFGSFTSKQRKRTVKKANKVGNRGLGKFF